MKWPWTQTVEEQKEATKRTEERRKRIESNWSFVLDQVGEAQRHRTENNITKLIIGVARGEH